MSIRIQLSRQTVKALQERLPQAYRRDDVRMVCRISALLDHLVNGVPVSVLAERWGFSPSTFYEWLMALLVPGLASLVYRRSGGRKAKLTPTQKKRLGKLIDAGPEAAGFDTACWNSILIRVLIERECGVASNRFYVCELLRNLGYSFQKARFVSDHLDEVKRQAWITQDWPQILKAARRRKALILFGDEASFPQWGSLSYTWARCGEQPSVKTSGKRKGYKVFGLIEYFSGRFFHQGIEGKFTSESYQAFLTTVLGQTRQPLFLIQDGAKYHTSASTRDFFAAHRARLTVFQLPSYSPDYNPIEYLWRKVKKEATHNKYFAAFEQLVHSVDKTLAAFAERAQEVLNLFGRYCAELGLAMDAAQFPKANLNGYTTAHSGLTGGTPMRVHYRFDAVQVALYRVGQLAFAQPSPRPLGSGGVVPLYLTRVDRLPSWGQGIGGRPVVGKPHAGQYEESTSWRQRGGSGSPTPLPTASLPRR